MPRPCDAAVGLVLAAFLGSLPGCSEVQPRALEVGRHRLQLVVPAGWEHLDHGREHLFRRGDNELSLADLGVATQEGVQRELRNAESLWRSGRTADAFARVSELRGALLEIAPQEQVTAFFRPWDAVLYDSDTADTATIAAAFAALMDGTATFAELSAESLIEPVVARCVDMARREIARREGRSIHGADWIEIETWDRVSHLSRSRLACTESGGNLLVLSMERGPLESSVAEFEALLASIEIAPAEAAAPEPAPE